MPVDHNAIQTVVGKLIGAVGAFDMIPAALVRVEDRGGGSPATLFPGHIKDGHSITIITIEGRHNATCSIRYVAAVFRG